MLYKTICRQVIQDHPQLYDQLLTKRNLLPTLDRYASQLRTSHVTWMDILAKKRPGSGEGQIASAAMEFALKELEEGLPSAYPQDENEPFSLDAAMAFIRSHTLPA
jgi:hypothetical protein